MVAPSLFANFFQVAYVTTDLARAVEVFKAKYGIGNFLTYTSDQMLTCPPGIQRCVSEIALAYVGDTQVEIIQPTGGDCPLYAAPLPTDRFAIQPHHYGFMVAGDELADWQRFRAQIGGADHPIAAEASIAAGSWAYVDERATLGHYTEYVWLGPDGRGFFGQVPRN